MSRHARGCKPGTAKPSRSVMSDLKNFAGKPARECRTRDQASENRLYGGGWGVGFSGKPDGSLNPRRE